MEQIKAKIAELQEIAMQVYGRAFPVQVKMNNRLSTTAGRAWLEQGLVEFSTKLYNENKESFLDDTVGHEFAHIVAFQVFQDKGHGAGWKSVVNSLGVGTKRCHSYQVAAKPSSSKHVYTCGCKEHVISPQRKVWMDKGKVYLCLACNKILVEKK